MKLLLRRFPSLATAWLAVLFACYPGSSQATSEADPAMVPILVWQLERGDTDSAEQLLRDNLDQIQPHLEAVLRMKQYYELLGSDPERYNAIRQSPCFEIYQARPASQYQTAR